MLTSCTLVVDASGLFPPRAASSRVWRSFAREFSAARSLLLTHAHSPEQPAATRSLHAVCTLSAGLLPRDFSGWSRCDRVEPVCLRLGEIPRPGVACCGEELRRHQRRVRSTMRYCCCTSSRVGSGSIVQHPQASTAPEIRRDRPAAMAGDTPCCLVHPDCKRGSVLPSRRCSC
jgi:hypothetical protein